MIRVAAPSLPLWAKRIIWHLDGHAGRSITFWIAMRRARYNICVGLARKVCRGDRWGAHTADFPVTPHRCLCDRARRRLDFIPF